MGSSLCSVTRDPASLLHILLRLLSRYSFTFLISFEFDHFTNVQHQCENKHKTYNSWSFRGPLQCFKEPRGTHGPPLEKHWFSFTLLLYSTPFCSFPFPLLLSSVVSVEPWLTLLTPSCSILFYSVLFCSIRFYSVLIGSILFYSALFGSILFYSVLFGSILFYSVLFGSIRFYSVLFCSIRFYSVLLSGTELYISLRLCLLPSSFCLAIWACVCVCVCVCVCA